MRTLVAALAAILVFCLCYVDAAELHNGNLLDAIELLQGRVSCGQRDCPCCPELSDLNDDGEINELDGIYLLQHLFNHTPLSDIQPTQDVQLTYALVHPTTEMYSAL